MELERTVREIEKGAAISAAPYAGQFHSVTDFELGDVIAERCPHHVIHGVRLAADSSGYTRPAVPIEIGVLQAPLHATFFALVDLMPEAQGGLSNVPRVTGAICASARRAIATRGKFRAASRVISRGPSVASGS